MRTALSIASVLLIAVSALGCGGANKTVVHRETVQTVPAAPIVQERRTVETMTEE